jgi:hypothetical protein
MREALRLARAKVKEFMDLSRIDSAGLGRYEDPKLGGRVMSLIQLVYVSRPFGFDEQTLSHILFKARHNNARDDITGALICRADLYLQLIEGPKAAIDALYVKIRADDRHIEVKKRLQRVVSERMFGAWAMKDDPARSWMWTQDEVDAGAVEAASEAQILAVFERVRAEIR